VLQIVRGRREACVRKGANPKRLEINLTVRGVQPATLSGEAQCRPGAGRRSLPRWLEMVDVCISMPRSL